MNKQFSLIHVFSDMTCIFLKKVGTVIILAFFIAPTNYAQTSLPIGSNLPLADQSMEEISGRNVSLNDQFKDNGLLVVFISNTCPWVRRWQDRLLSLSDFADDNEIGMVALNPNEGYRDRGDNMDEMIKHADKAGYDFPYLLDRDHVLADAFGATRTPEVFLFNSNRELVYTGSIDDNANNANGVQESHTLIAMDAIIARSSIQNSTTRLVGCSIKRSS